MYYLGYIFLYGFNSGGGIFAHSVSNLTANNVAPRNPNMDTRNGAQIIDIR